MHDCWMPPYNNEKASGKGLERVTFLGGLRYRIRISRKHLRNGV